MTDTNTQIERRAQELAKELLAAAHGSDIDWRVKQAEQWGRMNAYWENQAKFNDDTVRWQEKHERHDEVRFSTLEEKLDSKVASVSSGVGQLEKDKSFVGGAKWGIVAVIGGLFFLIDIGMRIWEKLP